MRTAQEMGWGDLKNGLLLAKTELEFDIFLTTDQNLQYQQNVRREKLSIVVVPTNYWPEIKAHAGEISAALASLKAGAFVELKWST
jgi:hypothetical protein